MFANVVMATSKTRANVPPAANYVPLAVAVKNTVQPVQTAFTSLRQGCWKGSALRNVLTTAKSVATNKSAPLAIVGFGRIMQCVESATVIARNVLGILTLSVLLV